MNNVVDLPVITKLDLDADRALGNLQGKLKGFVIAGYDKDGGDAIWLLERCKLKLLTQCGD